MPLLASTAGCHLTVKFHAQRCQLAKQLSHTTPSASHNCTGRLPVAPCGSRPFSHTLVHWPSVRAAYSGQRAIDDTGSIGQASTPSSQAHNVQHGSESAPQGSQQQQPASPSSIVSLMQAWGQLSTRLQQPAAGAAPGTEAQAGAANATAEEDVTQLILSALKLAVRSLSRVPTAADGGSPASSPASGSTTGSNLPAVQRSLALAAALAELYANGLPLDAASIAAGIVAEAVDVAALHIRSVQAKLGPEVAGLVHDVLAVRHAPDRVQLYDDANSSALRGWLLTAYDVRASAIEVVWRWLGLVQPPGLPHQQQLQAMEALTIYCPLGHALGLGGCSAALEDAAFKVLFPSSYASTARNVLPMSAAAAELLSRCQASLQAAADADAAFQALAGGLQLLSRTKSLYSIMRKLLRLNDPAAGSRRLGEMFDLLGMRAVVLPRKDLPGPEAQAAAVQACYRLQELAHAQWPPVPGRSKDYIARPKANGYRSLHSTLSMQQPMQQLLGSSSGGSSSSVVLSYLELQIRTAAMHAAAEGGDAAHAGYKGRLERRQVRHLQTWTAQLQQRLAGSKQQLLLPLPDASSTNYSALTTSSGDSDVEDSSVSNSSSVDSAGSASLAWAAAATELAQQQQQHQQQHREVLVDHQPAAAAAAAGALFHHLDLDGDGMLSLYELSELLTELGELRPAASAAAAGGAVSSQGAGRLQQLEFHNAAAAAAAAATPAVVPRVPYAQQVFESLDTNGDGLISMAEFLEFYMSNAVDVGSQTAAAAGPKLAKQQSSSGSSSSSSTKSSSIAWAAGGSSASSISSSSSSGVSLDQCLNGSSSSSSSSSTSGAVCQVFMHTQPGSSSSGPPASSGFGSSSGTIGSSSAFSSSRFRQHLRPPGIPTAGTWHSSSCGSAISSRRRLCSVRCGANAHAVSSSATTSNSSSSVTVSDSQVSSSPAQGTAMDASPGASNNSSSRSSSSSSFNGSAGVPQPASNLARSSITGSSQVNGASPGSVNSRAAAAVVAAADAGPEAASSSQQQQQQRQSLFRPLRRLTESGSQAAAEQGGSSSSAPAGEQLPEQLQPQQAGSTAALSGQQEEDAGAAAGDSSSIIIISSSYQQQLEAELSFEEDEQQQQRFLRQQQRQLPSLLEDAAAGRVPCYVLVPTNISMMQEGGSSSSSSSAFAGSSNGASSSGASVAPPLLADRLGQPLQQLEVPCLGPLLLTNAPQVFRSADVVVDAPGQHYERLALSLELVKPTGSNEAVLQARNLSRVVRGRLGGSMVRINYGMAQLQPHHAAVDLIDGDVLELGKTGVGFVVHRLERPAASPAAYAVQRFCGVYAQQQLGLRLPVQEAAQRQAQQHVAAAGTTRQQQQQQEPPAGWGAVAAAAAGQQGWNAAAADAIESQLRQISRLVRSNARAAEAELCQLAAAHPEAPGPWFLWAQLAASSRRHWMARALFRAAAVCQQQQLELVMRGGPAAAAVVFVDGSAQQPQLQQEGGEGAEGTAAAAAAAAEDAASSGGGGGGGAILTPVPSNSRSSSSGRRGRSSSDDASSRSPAFRLSSRLVQVLRVWARSDWDQRLFGPARRLWRLAANEAFKFPYDIAAEGGGAVLHSWATAEFDRDNVLNARVVIGEALRKCPKDAAVAVLAASIEAAAGEVNAARALFLRAYQLNKADKQLYMQWPRMEGSVGNTERARLLFTYGLSLFPNNTKILNLYACFEEEQGNIELARELHQRALGIDSSSLTSMHNRVSWAALELRQGDVGEARELLREGLDAHPDFPAALLLLAKLERLEGQLDLAEAYARRAQKSSHAFSVAAMGELAAIYAARGDTVLAANLRRHLANAEAAQSMKQAGKLHGNQAWANYYRQNAQPEQRQMIEAAWQRKRELGLIRQPHTAAMRRQQQQQQSGQGQQQQQQQGVLDELELDLGGVVEAFDFAAAAAAAAEPPAPES